MGMICHLTSASNDELGALLDSPPTVTVFIHQDRPGRLSTDLDMAWHGIHFLLAGNVWGRELPEGTLLAGGGSVSDLDLGCGPARALVPNEVRRFSDHLEAIAPTTFADRYDSKALAQSEVYPPIWDETARNYLLQYFSKLRTFLKSLADRGDGAVIWIS